MSSPSAQPNRKQVSPKKNNRQRANWQKNKNTSPLPQAPPLLRASGLKPARLLRAFGQLFVHAQIHTWLSPRPRGFYQRAFTPLVVLWYLVYQRLSPKHTLSQVVTDARDGGADRLSPRGRPLSQALKSEATTSYSDARQLLPLNTLTQALRHLAQQATASLLLPHWLGLRVGLLDGSTFRLRPFGDIPKEFPPHRTGTARANPYWCVARMVGLFCQASGLLMDSAVGSLKTSEQTLSWLLLQQDWAGWVIVGDRNFGVYSMVRAMVAAHAQAVVRLTEVRAKRLAKAMGHKLVAGLDLRLSWSPSPYDQIPAESQGLPVHGRLVVVRMARSGFRPMNFYLFTTLTDASVYTTEALAELYGRRWQVEMCFRYVKAEMDLGQLDCKSADMARKEWLAGLMAYNLVRWALGLAAAQAKVPVGSLSFSRARELIWHWLERCGKRYASPTAWARLLDRIGRCRQSKRRKLRPAQPRAVRPRRRDYADLKGSRAEACKKLAIANAKS